MRTWLRSVVNAILGKGKSSHPDTVTRMAMDPDFSDHREPTPPELPGLGVRYDQHPVKPTGLTISAEAYAAIIATLAADCGVERDSKEKE